MLPARYDDDDDDIADIHIGFSYHCFKYFVFNVRHVKFRDSRTRG